MVWPFKRRPKYVEYDEDGELIAFRADNPAHQQDITEFLELARETSKSARPGEDFIVVFPEEKRAHFDNPLLLIGPLMMRAHEYGLEPPSCFDWEFTFATIIESTVE